MTDLNILLVKLSQNQDAKLLQQIYDASKVRLFSVCLRILQDQQLAEDCLQESFIKVWHKANTYAPEKSEAITWLSRIVRNQAIDMLRRNQRLIFVDEMPDIEDQQANQQQLVEDLEMGAKLQQCLADLKPEQRHCIMASYYGGETAQQIADKLERPVSTVKTWMARSMPVLKRCLEYWYERHR